MRNQINFQKVLTTNEVLSAMLRIFAYTLADYSLMEIISTGITLIA